MQVSWIDAEQIKALVAQIAPLEEPVEDSGGVMEIDTTPEAPRAEATTWGFAMDWSPPPARPAPAAVVAETTFAGSIQPQPQPEVQDEVEPETQDHTLHNSAAALPLSRIRDKLRAIRQRATEAGILTRTSEAAPPEPAPIAPVPVEQAAPGDGDAAPAEIGDDAADMPETAAEGEPESKLSAASSQTPVFEIPHGSREVRLAAFAGWARQVLHEDGGHVLVMSDDGEVLWGGEAKAGLVLSTMMAWGAAIRASAMSACETPPLIHQPLASGNVLTVIPCETPEGMVHAAVAAPAGLSHEQAHVLRGALCAAMD